MIKRIFLILILCGIAFFIFVISTFDEGYLKNRVEAIEAEKANNYLTRLGIVVTTEKQPIDSVTFFDYNNEIITRTDSVGFFKITREKEVFIHAIILKKKDYITDTIHYYNKEINEWDPVYRGYNDTIVLKREEKWNVGYVNNKYKYESYLLFEKDSWIYIDDTLLDLKGRCKVDLEFSYTAAHEIGHNILRSYAEGGGSADYSYKHKGSSGYSETKSVSEGGVIYPRKGEIDLMKYYNNTPYFLNFDFDRIVAAEEDVKGLLWLTKIKIKKWENCM